MDTDFEFRVCIEYSDFGDKIYVVRLDNYPYIIGVGDKIEEAIEEAKGNFEVYLKYCEEKHIASGQGTFIKKDKLKTLKPDKYAIDWFIYEFFKKFVKNEIYKHFVSIYKIDNYSVIFTFDSRGSFFIRCTDDWEQEFTQEFMQEKIELTKDILINKIRTEAKETNKRER